MVFGNKVLIKEWWHTRTPRCFLMAVSVVIPLKLESVGGLFYISFGKLCISTCRWCYYCCSSLL